MADLERIAALRTTSRETLIVTLDTGRGRAKVHMRTWFDHEQGPRPGRESVEIPADRIENLIVALQTARMKLTGGGAL